MSDPSTPPPEGPVEKPLLLEQEMKDSYLSYAMSVIVSRALPDVRDGLKPSQRRVLVAMHDLNLGPRSKHRKCAKIAGDTSGNYHPHGEAVIYPTLVRMAQPFNMRHRLVDGQGNFGSVDGDPPAAMRYTEARMTAESASMMDDIDLDTVDFIPNYEGTRSEPTVLPARFPNLLVNGTNGIAVGMATSMAPHNLGEVCRGIKALIADPELDVDGLMEHIPGPDFPTGGILCGNFGAMQAYRTGRGQVTVRGKTSVEDHGKGRQRIVITEIPFQVNKATLVEKIAEHIKEGRLEGASDVRDESDKDGMRIVVELKKGEDDQVILNRLFQYTQLQDSFSIINIALVDGRPKTLNLRQLCQEFIRHRRVVIIRRTRFLMNRALERLHILEGLLIAQQNIDEVIQTIKESSDPEDARLNLIKRFQLTRKQADAICQLRLQRLTALEVDKIKEEHAKVTADIEYYRKVLSEPAEVDRIITEDLDQVEESFANARRTEIGEPVDDVVPEDLIADEEMTVIVSRKGYVKRVPSDTYRAQRRGGKGIAGTETQDDDFVSQVFLAMTHDYLLCFTDRGRVHWLKVYQLPMLSRYSRGRAITNLIQLQEDENVNRIIAVRDFATGFLVMATQQGFVKKTELSAFQRPMRGGIIALGLRDDDRLVDVRVARAGDHILLATRKGYALHCSSDDMRAQGRPAMGVRGIKLRDEDAVVSMILAREDASVLTICEFGYGKRTELAEYRVQGRGGMGIINIKATERNGDVVGVIEVTDEDDLMIATQLGQVVRTPVAEISTIGRATQGVRIISFKKKKGEGDDKVASIGRMVRDDDAISPEGAEAVDAEGATPAASTPVEPVDGDRPDGDAPEGGDAPEAPDEDPA